MYAKFPELLLTIERVSTELVGARGSDEAAKRPNCAACERAWFSQRQIARSDTFSDIWSSNL